MYTIYAKKVLLLIFFSTKSVRLAIQRPPYWFSYSECLVHLSIMLQKSFFLPSEEDILDLCRNSFDEILQVLVLKNRTKAASRAITGCGSNQ